MAARVADGDTTPYVFTASGAQPPAATRHQPHKCKNYEAQEPKKNDQSDTNGCAGIGRVNAQLIVRRTRLGRSVANAGDDPDQEDEVPNVQNPCHLPPPEDTY
jgi:hypothetical protein